MAGQKDPGLQSGNQIVLSASHKDRKCLFSKICWMTSKKLWMILCTKILLLFSGVYCKIPLAVKTIVSVAV